MVTDLIPTSKLQRLTALAHFRGRLSQARRWRVFPARNLSIGWFSATVVVFLLAGMPVESADSGNVLPLHHAAGKLRTADVLINGKAAHMLLDTGAGITSVTPRFAETIECKPIGRIVGFGLNGQRVEYNRCGYASISLAGVQRQLDVAVLDLGKTIPAMQPQVDGVIGLDAFRGERVTLLSGLRGIKIERSSAIGPRRGVEGHMRLSSEYGGAGLRVFVPVKTVNLDLWFLLDSTNQAGIRLHPMAYDQLGTSSPDGTPNKLTFGITGAGLVERVPLVAPDMIYDGALDAEFIGGFDVTIDFGTQRIWWAKTTQ